jgi:hypothetical protein
MTGDGSSAVSVSATGKGSRFPVWLSGAARIFFELTSLLVRLIISESQAMQETATH